MNLYTWYYYDADSNLQYVVDAAGASSNRPTTFSASTAYTTQYVYDNLGQKIEEIDPLNAAGGYQPTTTDTYNQSGNLASTTDADGNTTTYAYNIEGRQTQVTNALGETTTVVYDAVGNVLFVTDALGRTTAYQYDSMNRKIAEAEPLPDSSTNPVAPQQVEGQLVGGGEPTTTWQYDANGNVIAVTDPLSHTSWTQYDGWNLPVAVTDALGAYKGDPQHTATMTYSLLGNVLTVTDQLGRGNRIRLRRKRSPAPLVISPASRHFGV